MNIAIIGYGVEGQAAYDYWKDGNQITICDQSENIQIPVNVGAQLGEKYLDGLERFDLVVRSPFVRPDALHGVDPKKITSNTNEFMRVCPTRNIIGITGTKGKGTTSTLVTRMLEAAGKRVHLGGNIGVAALELLKEDIQADDWVVLELSSFQLIDLKTAPHIAACLMVVPEHQDWHTDIDEYYQAKQQLFAHQTEQDITVFFSDNEQTRSIASASPGTAIPYYETPGATVEGTTIMIDGISICETNDLRLLGEHNWQNACAAVTICWQVTQDATAMYDVLTSFSGLEHRLELVRELDGIHYYDDSFGTTPETAIVAIKAFDSPKVVILGGSDKGASYDDLARTVAEAQIRKVLLIGDQASRIQSALEQVGFTDFTNGGETMEAIVANAKSFAQAGDTVLLSTGCASFGMFKNYKDRGNQFKQAVLALV